MKSTLRTGLEASRRIVLDASRVISFMGDDCRVYATPSIIYDVEWCCHDMLMEHLDAGEDSVGTRVDVEHVGAALLGSEVEVKVVIEQLEGRRVRWRATVRDGDGEVLRGMHERFIVDTEKVRQRLLRKTIGQRL